MIKVWILIAIVQTYNGQGGTGVPVVVDNLATNAECRRVMENIRNISDGFKGRCVEVWKAKS